MATHDQSKVSPRHESDKSDTSELTRLLRRANQVTRVNFHASMMAGLHRLGPLSFAGRARRDRPGTAFAEHWISRVSFVALVSQAKRLLGWLVSPPVERVPRWWLHCPICDEQLVGPYPAGTIVPVGQGGLSFLDPTREELIAKCPAHGHLPYNDPTKKPTTRRAPTDR